MLTKIRNAFDFLILNFGPLFGFYIFNHFFGFEVGIYASIVIVFTEYFCLRFRKLNINKFFYFSSAIVLIFGTADLLMKEAFFIRYEASATNLLFALFFGLSLLNEKPLVQEFAESQNRVLPESSPDTLFFFRAFTIFWCIYFLLKAAFFLWISFNVTFSEASITRIIIGNVSFWIMMFISIGLPTQIWNLMERLRLFPSQRSHF